MDIGVILFIRYEVGVWIYCDYYNGNFIKSKIIVIE